VTTIDATLARRVNRGSGENAYKCYQCKKCSTGCPVAGFGDLHPAQIMRAVQLGAVEAAVDSRFIWLCTGCETCSTRCPQGIDVAAVMDELRMIAREQGRVRSDAPFANILRLNYDSFRRWGRLYEVELLALDKATRPASFADDVGMGIRMFLKGKINPLPTVGDRAQMKRMAQVADRITRDKRAIARAMDLPAGTGPASSSRGGAP
jgi:heterodisulfide reductase subunit C